MKTTDTNNSELLLRAFRYYNDEMNGAERGEFEQLLGCDLAAQEALADVVVLQESLLVQSGSVLIQTKSSSLSLSKIAALAVTAASIALMILSSTLSPTSKTSPDSEIASLPIEVKTGDVETVRLWTMMGRDSEFSEDVADSNLMSIAMAELDVPDWMFAAVEASGLEEEMDIFDFDDDEETL